MTVTVARADPGGEWAVLAAGRARLVDGVARSTGDDWLRIVDDAAVATRGDPRTVDAVYRALDRADDATPTDRVARVLRGRRLDAVALVATPDGGDAVTLRRVDPDGTVTEVSDATLGGREDVVVESDALATAVRAVGAAVVERTTGPVDVVAVTPDGATERHPPARA